VFSTAVRQVLPSASQLGKTLRPDPFRELPDEFVLLTMVADTGP
jgi:hypothetical protein